MSRSDEELQDWGKIVLNNSPTPVRVTSLLVASCQTSQDSY